MEQKKVLHVFNKMDRGGAELRTLDVLKYIDKDRYKFYFCSLSGEKGELDETIEALGGKMVYCRLKDASFPKNFITLLKKLKIDVVHANMYYFSGVILLLAKYAKVPNRIAHFRSADSGKLNTVISSIKYHILKSMIYKYATNIVGVSRAAIIGSLGEKSLEDKRTKILYNGIDTSKLNQVKQNGIPLEKNLRLKYNLKKKDKILIHIGRMTEAKNHLQLIDIFQTYVSSNQNAYLFLIGKKDEEIYGQIKLKLKKYSLQEKVHFLGVQSNVYIFLKQADCMIYPSTREGLPGAVLEAVASGTPVVLSDIKPHKELAEHIPSLKCISLKKSSEMWKIEIEKVLENKQYHKDEKLVSEFEDSPFNLYSFIENYKELYK